MRGTACHGVRVAFALGWLVAASGAARADGKWWEGITLNGFASASYTWNVNQPPDNKNLFRAFDDDHNSFRLDGVQLLVQRAAVNRGDIGFKLDLTAGAIARVSAARGLFRDVDTAKPIDFDVKQAYVSWIIPLGKGLRLDVGKFVTPVGYELIDGYEGINDTFSRSWLFTYGPYTHTGLKLSYAFNDKLSATVMLVNGWDNVVDNNRAKSFGVSFAYTPLPMLAIAATYLGGPERDGEDGDFRHLADLVVQIRPHWRIAVVANVDFGYEHNGVIVSQPMIPGDAPVVRADAKWVMAALYARVGLHKRVYLNVRGELFYDFDGNRTGTAQRLLSLTLTPELRATESLVFRAEGRIDQSDQFVFPISEDVKRKYQPTVGVNALYLF
jgi:hypothetical protein